MSDPLASVTPGDPLRISADTFNLLLDAGKFVRDRRLGRTGAGQALDEPVTPALQVYVRNDTGASLAAFSVVALGTPVISATDAQHTVRRQPVFPGTAAAASTDAFAVTIEPLASGKVGRAVVMGVVPVDLNVTDSAHTAATPAAGVTATLASATNGPARIIWKASGTGTKRAVVLIGRDQNGGSITNVYGTTIISTPTTLSGSYQNIAGPTIPSNGVYVMGANINLDLKVSAIDATSGMRVNGGIARNSTILIDLYESVDVANVLRTANISTTVVNVMSTSDVINFRAIQLGSGTWTTCDVVSGSIWYYKMPG